MADTNKSKKPLKRSYDVKLSDKEANNLKQYKNEKAGMEYLSGKPRLIKKRNGKYVAKIFKRFGIIYGSTTAIGKIKFINDRELKVVVKSGGLGLGYFMLTICVLFGFALIGFLLNPAVTEELELNLSAFVFAIPVFALLSWLFLSRYMRQPELDDMETYLKNKIGGEWRET